MKRLKKHPHLCCMTSSTSVDIMICTRLLMFNCDFSLEDILSSHPKYFEEVKQEFDELTNEDTMMIDGKNYIYFNLKLSSEKK